MRIKEILKEKNITQKDFATMLGISISGLTQQINGKPSLSTLERYAEVLNINLWELFKEPEPKETGTQIYCPHCNKPIKVNITKE